MKLDKKTVEYMAKLARVKLSEGQLESLSLQLGTILKYAKKLNEIDVAGVEPTTHVLSLENVYREDELRPSLNIKDVLSNAPQKEENFFKVPKIIG